MHDAANTVYILAGGRSRRFGRDKARAEVKGVPMLARQAVWFGDRGWSVVAVGQRAGQYDDLGVVTIGDERPDGGPVEGLRTALRHCREGWLLLTSCDLLEVRESWLESLESARAGSGDDTGAVVFRGERWQPFPGMYHTRLLDAQADWHGGSFQRLLDRAEVYAVDAPEAPGIRQANTPEELDDGAWPR